MEPEHENDEGGLTLWMQKYLEYCNLALVKLQVVLDHDPNEVNQSNAYDDQVQLRKHQEWILNLRSRIASLLDTPEEQHRLLLNLKRRILEDGVRHINYPQKGIIGLGHRAMPGGSRRKKTFRRRRMRKRRSARYGY